MPRFRRLSSAQPGRFPPVETGPRVLFNSIQFPLFLAIVFVLYWSARRAPLQAQNTIVLAASYVFYGWWDWRFLGLIAGSSLLDFFLGLQVHKQRAPTKRKALLAMSLLVNLGGLAIFKYLGFFVASTAELLTSLGLQPNLPTLHIILPVGISFYTFQTLSYTIDIYRRKIEPTRDIVGFLAFVSFFPQLVAGPIERAAALLPQFLVRRQFDVTKAKDGLRQILWGLFKKVVIADNLSGQVRAIFDGYASLDGVALTIGALFFALQIYCDFSGYSDIAIGTARLFGFNLTRNFAFPYFSRDIGEFWRRWHISLSSWFRDYVYIPLGGSRLSTASRIRNIVITFTVSGFWHGANWTFIVWGLLNGLYYIPLMLANKRPPDTVVAVGRLLPSLNELIAMMITFALTLIAWVFFRAESLTHAIQYLWRGVSHPWLGLDLSGYGPGLIACAILLALEWFQRDKQHALELSQVSVLPRWFTYISVALAIFVFGHLGATEFIYFQF